MIQAFIELTTDLKICGINSGLHLMDNRVSTALEMAMTTMDIKCQLVPPIYQREINSDRSI